MSSDVTLTAAQRTGLLSLQKTDALSQQTQNRLSSSRRVNSVVDGAVDFFVSKSLNDRAVDFNLRKDGIDQGISTLQAALRSTRGVDSLLKQMKGIAQAARSQSNSERDTATRSFEEIGKQIFQLVQDSSYQGLNLLNSTNSTLEVEFGVRTGSELEVKGKNLLATGANIGESAGALFTISVFSAQGGAINVSNFGLSGGSFTSLGANNSKVSFASTVINRIDAAVTRLRATSSELGANVSILNTRLNFTNSYTDRLTVGSDKLTLANLNEEGANLVSLETRQRLGIQTLAVAAQDQQALLALL